MEKEVLIAIILGILVLVVVAQGLQLNSLNANLAAAAKSGSLSASQSSSTQQTSAPSQPSAPVQQVGGC